jgi:hypothetical protein
LQALLMLIGDAGVAVPPALAGVNALTRFGAAARYPGDPEPITPDELEHAIALARNAIAWARARILPSPQAQG